MSLAGAGIRGEIAENWSRDLEQNWSSLAWPLGTSTGSECPRTLWNRLLSPAANHRPVVLLLLQKGPLGACGQKGPPRALICRSVASQISSEARPPPKRMKRVGIGKAPQA